MQWGRAEQDRGAARTKAHAARRVWVRWALHITAHGPASTENQHVQPTCSSLSTAAGDAFCWRARSSRCCASCSQTPGGAWVYTLAASSTPAGAAPRSLCSNATARSCPSRPPPAPAAAPPPAAGAPPLSEPCPPLHPAPLCGAQPPSEPPRRPPVGWWWWWWWCVCVWGGEVKRRARKRQKSRGNRRTRVHPKERECSGCRRRHSTPHASRMPLTRAAASSCSRDCTSASAASARAAAARASPWILSSSCSRAWRFMGCRGGGPSQAERLSEAKQPGWLARVPANLGGPGTCSELQPLHSHLHARLQLQSALLRQLLRLLRPLCRGLRIRALLGQLLPLLCCRGGLQAMGGSVSGGKPWRATQPGIAAGVCSSQLLTTLGLKCKQTSQKGCTCCSIFEASSSRCASEVSSRWFWACGGWRQPGGSRGGSRAGAGSADWPGAASGHTWRVPAPRPPGGAGRLPLPALQRAPPRRPPQQHSSPRQTASRFPATQGRLPRLERVSG